MVDIFAMMSGYDQVELLSVLKCFYHLVRIASLYIQNGNVLFLVIPLFIYYVYRTPS